MSPQDRDATIREGWRKMEHLPQFLICTSCGSASDPGGVETHEKWHAWFEAGLARIS